MRSEKSRNCSSLSHTLPKIHLISRFSLCSLSLYGRIFVFLLLGKQLINNNPIGIFDSGVGGLSVVKAINELMPNEKLIYVADSQYTPYGDRDPEFISQRVHKITEFLMSEHVKALVIACNTATAAAVKTLREQLSLPIIGLEPALKPAIEYSKTKRLGVLATQYTLDSQKYAELKVRYANNVSIIEKASPLFVELVERSPEIGNKEIALIENELHSFQNEGIDSLVLGCTHYPFLQKTIQKIMGPQVRLFESGLPVAKELKRKLKDSQRTDKTPGDILIYSSAPKEAQEKFAKILGRPVEVRKF